jgi:hypothetical protein
VDHFSPIARKFHSPRVPLFRKIIISSAKVFGIVLILASSAFADKMVSFDDSNPGLVPQGWIAGSTGGGAPDWKVVRESSAPSPPNVLKQAGYAPFPWIVKKDAWFADGFVEVKIRPISGGEDRAGGVIWRWKDGDDYYVARINALENNVSLYYTLHGKRNTIKYADAPLSVKQWHTLRVEFSGKKVAVSVDGRVYISLEDDHITGSGAVGLWTKADSVTLFDDFEYGGPADGAQ